MTRALFFDAGPIISLVMSRLEWLLPKLKEQYQGKFYITPAVKKELIERPIKIKRFGFEALQVMKLLEDGILEVYSEIPKDKVEELKNLANTSFKIGKKNMDVLQSGEVESVAAALKIDADAVVMDERTLRLFMENSPEMEKLLKIRFKKEVVANQQKMKKFTEQLKGIKIIRSIELVSVAYKLGFLNEYLPKQKGGKDILLDSVLWLTKYNGCAVSKGEIEEIKSLLL